jgi:hypothetical protein
MPAGPGCNITGILGARTAAGHGHGCRLTSFEIGFNISAHVRVRACPCALPRTLPVQ